MAAVLSNVEKAGRRYVSVATVKTQINHLLGKLRLTSRVQPVAIAHEYGLVLPGHASPVDRSQTG
jgi:DNA-binding NarL/FixJ family response regulator